MLGPGRKGGKKCFKRGEAKKLEEDNGETFAF